jgi:hypothetical protein
MEATSSKIGELDIKDLLPAYQGQEPKVEIVGIFFVVFSVGVTPKQIVFSWSIVPTNRTQQ